MIESVPSYMIDSLPSHDVDFQSELTNVRYNAENIVDLGEIASVDSVDLYSSFKLAFAFFGDQGDDKQPPMSPALKDAMDGMLSAKWNSAMFGFCMSIVTQCIKCGKSLTEGTPG
jgi:hypothetical protein